MSGARATDGIVMGHGADLLELYGGFGPCKDGPLAKRLRKETRRLAVRLAPLPAPVYSGDGLGHRPMRRVGADNVEVFTSVSRVSSTTTSSSTVLYPKPFPASDVDSRGVPLLECQARELGGCSARLAVLLRPTLRDSRRSPAAGTQRGAP